MHRTEDKLDVEIMEAMRVEVGEENQKCTQLHIHNCDHGVIVALVAALNRDSHVHFAGVVETHPLYKKSELLVRTDESATPAEAIMLALSVLTRLAVDSENWQVGGTHTEDVSECADGTCSRVSLSLTSPCEAWANAVRRTMLGSVPVLAIIDITFRRNTSFMCDEILAHRLSMIPVCYNRGELPGVEQQSVCFSLNVHSPPDALRTICRVSSAEVVSNTPETRLAFSEGDGFTVTRLAPDQSVDLVARVGIGCAGTHERFAVVSKIGFESLQDDGYRLDIELTGRLKPSVLVKHTMQILADTIVTLRMAMITRQTL